MYRRRTVRLLIWLLALSAMTGQYQAFAQSPQSHRAIRVDVESLVAADTHKGIDPRLGADTTGRLRKVFDYTSYVLLKREQASTVCGQAVAFNLPGGRILHVAPMAVEGNMIALELVLFEGARSVMRTDIKMMKAGAIMIVGPHYPRQTFITTIEASDVPRVRPAEAPTP
jgi:hypothetical protein